MTTKTLQDLEDEYESDCHIDGADLGTEAMRMPNLHQKWLRYLNHFKIRAFTNKKKLQAMESLRLRYFKGELGQTSLAEHGWEPWNLKHKVNADIEKWLQGDSVLTPMREKQFALETCLEHCAEVLKGIKDRGYAIRNTMDWRKFEAGN